MLNLFLLKGCMMADISQEIKIKNFDLSVLNKAPFHKKIYGRYSMFFVQQDI